MWFVFAIWRSSKENVTRYIFFFKKTSFVVKSSDNWSLKCCLTSRIAPCLGNVQFFFYFFFCVCLLAHKCWGNLIGLQKTGHIVGLLLFFLVLFKWANLEKVFSVESGEFDVNIIALFKIINQLFIFKFLVFLKSVLLFFFRFGSRTIWKFLQL